MSTSKPGIQLVPPLPAAVVTGSASSRDLADILQFRNQLVETRNSQLEHKQTAAQLFDKIRQACRDLSRKDNSVKEGMEILNVERYLGMKAYAAAATAASAARAVCSNSNPRDDP